MRTLRVPNLARAAAAVALLFLSAGIAAAQVADAVIEVVVGDEAGAPLPGATVRATRSETGLERQSVSDGVGVARLPNLPPGSYRVVVELPGVPPVTQEEVVLRVGQTARVKVTLQLRQAEAVTVSAEVPVVDVYKMDSASVNIVPEQIQELPVADRDFQRLAFIAPGVQRERGGFRFIGGGPVLGAGGNASQSTIMVDGVDFTDPALGLARTRFSQDAISEFRVIGGRFDSEIGGSQGGALSVVTRSGSNDFAGTVFGFFRDDSLREQGELEQQKNEYSREQYGFTLGGPFVRDKTHWFLSFEQINEDNITLFRPVGPTYGPLAADLPHPFDQTLGFVGLDHRLSDSQTLSAKGVYEDYSEENFRVGGVSDESSGQQLNRENWNASVAHVWVPGTKTTNELRVQYGERSFDEPTNSDAVAEYFSSGNTLVTGGNILGDLLGEGDLWEVRDTFALRGIGPNGAHDLKAGFSVQRINERSRIDVAETGWFLYVTDTRALPLLYIFGVGSSDIDMDTTRYGVFVQDDWRPKANIAVSLGVRYDYDTDANNPDFEHPLVPNGRDVDSDNIQPRFGFSWDIGNDGRHVVRGGAGIFTGRYVLVPSFAELQQNGVTGRVLRRNLNGALIGLPAFRLDPANPTTTGLPLNPDIALLATEYEAPETTQVSLGFTAKLWNTGLYADIEGQYADGDNEIIIRDTNWGGNANPVRLNSAYNQINTYTNEGHSEYKALILSVNGALRGGHILTASFTLAEKKNINDDFSPALTDYPDDPADIEAEYGRSRADERYRFVMSGVIRAPWDITVAPIFEYGSGQPWNRRLGYDFNGDGRTSDRAPGVERFSEDGPPFRQFSLRVTKTFGIGPVSLDLIAEAFNLFDTTNYAVDSIQTGEFLSGPTLANAALPSVANPLFGQATATFPGREIQLGLRVSF
jgi:hypothetical protein